MKFGQIKGSIEMIGLVEPIVVTENKIKPGNFLILDGVLRAEALRDLGFNVARCMISRDVEGFTYNKHVNRLSIVQEHRMILMAVERGVSIERLAQTIGATKHSIEARFRLLDGICPEAVALLADKPATSGLFKVLRKMKPMRQIDVATTLINLNNYSIKLSLAMLQATPPDQLIAKSHDAAQSGATSEALQRLEKELAAVRADTQLLEDSYGPANLQLVIIKTYIRKILDSAQVVRWLATKHPEYLQQIQFIAEIDQLHTV